MHSDADILFTAWRDGAEPFHGHIETIGAGVIDDLGPIHGASPLVFGGEYVAYQTGGADKGYPIVLHELLSDRTQPAGNGKGVGLSRIVDTTVRTWDDERGVVPGLHDPCWAGELVVGATDRDGQPCAVVQHADGRELELWKGQDSQNPMMAYSPTDRYVLRGRLVGQGAGCAGDGIRARGPQAAGRTAGAAHAGAGGGAEGDDYVLRAAHGRGAAVGDGRCRSACEQRARDDVHLAVAPARGRGVA